MRPPEDEQLPQSGALEVDVSPPSSWQQVEEFVAECPPFPPPTPELKAEYRQALAAFHRDVAHLPRPMPERVAEFVRALERAAS